MLGGEDLFLLKVADVADDDAGLHHLRPFAKSDCNNKWLAKSSTSFPSAVAERLRERAAHEVNEYYRNKENRHPHFGEDDWFETWCER